MLICLVILTTEWMVRGGLSNYSELKHMNWFSAVFCTWMVCGINLCCFWLHMLLVDLFRSIIWSNKKPFLLWKVTMAPIQYLHPILYREWFVDFFTDVLAWTGYGSFHNLTSGVVFCFCLIYHVRVILCELFGNIYLMSLPLACCRPYWVTSFCCTWAIFGHMCNAWDSAQEIATCVEVFGQYVQRKTAYLKSKAHSSPFHYAEWGSWTFVLYDVRGFEVLAKEYGWQRVLFCCATCFFVDTIGFFWDLVLIDLVRPDFASMPMYAGLIWMFDEFKPFSFGLLQNLYDLYIHFLKFSGLNSFTEFRGSVFFNFTFILTLPVIGFTHIPVLLLSFIGSYCYPTYFSIFFRALICIQCSLGILQHFLQLLVGFIKWTHLLTQVFALCLSTQRVNSLFTSVKTNSITTPGSSVEDFLHYAKKARLLDGSKRHWLSSLKTILITRDSAPKEQTPMTALAQVLAEAEQKKEPYKVESTRVVVQPSQFVDHSLLFSSHVCEPIYLEECGRPKCKKTHCSNGSQTRFARCRGCLQIRYCSEECAKKHWKHHKGACKNAFKKFDRSYRD